MSAGLPSRSPNDLTDEERRQLTDAHAELRAAVAAYEQFLGRELTPGQDTQMVPGASLRAAQERIDAAETELWRLRQRLLGWSRPAREPSASLVADWFSPEDAAYDDAPDATAF